jgi:hypothetical protein
MIVFDITFLLIIDIHSGMDSNNFSLAVRLLAVHYGSVVKLRNVACAFARRDGLLRVPAVRTVCTEINFM